MTKNPFHRNARRLSIATLLIVGGVVGDAVAGPGSAPVPPAPAAPPVKAPVPSPKPAPRTQVPTNKSAGQSNYYLGIEFPHRVKLPPAGPIVLPPVFNIGFWDSNNSANAAPATRVLVALNGVKIGVMNLPAFPAAPAVLEGEGWGISEWKWKGPSRGWTIITPEVPCARLEQRALKYPTDSFPPIPNNERQYHSGCFVDIKIWKDVPDKIPCTFIGSICIELLPTATPAYSGQMEVLDEVSQYPPCAGAAGPLCTFPGFGWKRDPSP